MEKTKMTKVELFKRINIVLIVIASFCFIIGMMLSVNHYKEKRRDPRNILIEIIEKSETHNEYTYFINQKFRITNNTKADGFVYLNAKIEILESGQPLCSMNASFNFSDQNPLDTKESEIIDMELEISKGDKAAEGFLKFVAADPDKITLKYTITNITVLEGGRHNNYYGEWVVEPKKSSPDKGTKEESKQSAEVSSKSEPQTSSEPTKEIPVEESQTIEVSKETSKEEPECRVYEKCLPSCCTVYVTEKNGYSLGSGFVLTADGYIATNQHVVDGGIKFKVIFYDGTEYEAKVVGEDPVRDLAVLRIEAKGLTPLEIGNSDSLTPEQIVIAIRNSADLTTASSMAKGVICEVKRNIGITDSSGSVSQTMTLIQTDISINSGNIDGPLINLQGQVIGIISSKIVKDYFESIGFAIPINCAADIFNQLIQYGKVVNEPEDDFVHAAAYLGIQVTNADNGLEGLRIKPSCEYPEGAFVASVTSGTAVYAAGLQPYDIITEFCGVKITDITSLTDELANHKAGETVSMTFFRFDRRFASGEYLTIKFVLDSAK